MSISRGPSQEPLSREVVEHKKRAVLWSAVWEASQILTSDEIRALVEVTLIEIESDAE